MVILCSQFHLELLERIDNFGHPVEYDTTFELGDFYLSYITIPNVMLHGSPCFYGPAILHTSKTSVTHSMFFTVLKDLGAIFVSIGTDQEQAICNSIELIYPETINMICWRHFNDNIDRKLKDLKVEQVDREKVLLLLHGKGNDQGILYSSNADILADTWPTFEKALLNILGEEKGMVFANYMKVHMYNRIRDHMLPNILDKAGCVAPFYTNRAEGKNRSLKRDLRGRLSLFSMVESYHLLCSNEEKEWYRGRLGFGTYRLSSLPEAHNLALTIRQFQKLAVSKFSVDIQAEYNSNIESMPEPDRLAYQCKISKEMALSLLQSCDSLIDIGAIQETTAPMGRIWIVTRSDIPLPVMVVEREARLECTSSCDDFNKNGICVCMVSVGRKLKSFCLLGKILSDETLQLSEFENKIQKATNLNDVVIRQEEANSSIQRGCRYFQ